MDRLINVLAKLAIFKNDFDYHLIRVSGDHLLWLSEVVSI
jgi:hypothetical protein